VDYVHAVIQVSHGREGEGVTSRGAHTPPPNIPSLDHVIPLI